MNVCDARSSDDSKWIAAHASPRICELVRYHMRDVDPAALELHPHALADVARLPVREIVSGAQFIADLTLDLGEVVFDYLGKRKP